MKGCGKNIDGWNRCGVKEMETAVMYCDECKASQNREEGYYWVKADGEWHIAYCFGSFGGRAFQILDSEYHEDEFDEIDENRIVRGE